MRARWNTSNFCNTYICCLSQETLSNMKGNFLILLVTENTTYTPFDFVYTKIMLYTQQILLSQSDQSCLYRDTSCISTNTDVYVVYPQLHPVYAQIRVVSQHIELYIQGHMLFTYGYKMYYMFECIRCLNQLGIWLQKFKYPRKVK